MSWRRHVGVVFGLATELAARREVALVREGFVGDALLDVVGFAGEDQQGFILRLPAEASNGPVVARAIGNATDAVLSLGVGVGGSIGGSEASEISSTSPSQRGSGNAEDDVVLRDSGGEVRLRIDAARSIRTSGDGEKVVHPAVGRSVRIGDEARFADRSVYKDELGKLVGSLIEASDLDLRIDRGT